MSGEASADDELIEGVPQQRFPGHVAIIMDGNGRWAEHRGKPRHDGHRMGAQAVTRIVLEGVRLGLNQLTFYSFSSENWNRPQQEVDLLMGLYRSQLIAELGLIMRNNVRFRVIGDIAGLPKSVSAAMGEAERISSTNTGLILCLALNYGARDEILRAVRGIATDVRDGSLEPAQIDAALMDGRLDTAGMPEPDLMIRTAGEKRLSNFLLWQLSYAELYFTDLLWPDFDEAALRAAIREYAARRRRFGGLPGEKLSEKEGDDAR